jgi:hypothetical protein
VLELDQQTQNLRDRAGEIEIDRAELRHRLSELDGREKELASCSRQLDYRQQEIATALERFERLGVTEERMNHLQTEAAEFAARRRYLDEAESQLTQEKTGLAEQIRELDRQRRQFQELTTRERRALEAQQQQSHIEQRQRDEQFDRREAELDNRETALEQMRSELRITQREVLEMRLATEEAWAQLAGAIAPATLTRSISIVRAQLADHYRQTLDQISQQSEQLEGVRSDLAQQLDALEAQRREMAEWLQRRHEEIEQQAARLVTREQELDRQQHFFEQAESHWQLERTESQTEIRRLLAALRSVELHAA